MARIVVASEHPPLADTRLLWDNWCVAREFADAAKADAVFVNGDLAINGRPATPRSPSELTARAGERAHACHGSARHRRVAHALTGGQDPDQIIDADRLTRWDSFFGSDRWTLDAGGRPLVGVNAQLFGLAWHESKHRTSGSTSS